MAANRNKTAQLERLEKCPTGISGLDEVTGGGLPSGRPTLVCGGRRLRQDAARHGVPGPRRHDASTSRASSSPSRRPPGSSPQNVASLGFDLEGLWPAGKKLAIDHVHVERSEIEETGEYDLEGLFVRLGHAIDSVGAKRIVLDTVEILFPGLPNPAILRAELRRLFRLAQDRGASPPSSPASAGTSSPAMASRSTSPTA